MDLVLQGSGATRTAAAELAPQVGARAPETHGAGAYLLREATPFEGLGAWCGARAIDWGWLHRPVRLADMRLLAMDMDSTLITIECIDEIGAAAGRKAEIAGITARAMRGEIEFTESLKRRVALLEGVPEQALEQVYRDKLRLSPGAERLLEASKAAGLKLMLVSGGFSFFTERLRARLGFDIVRSNALEIERGRLTGRLLGEIVNARVKAEAVRAAARALGARREQLIAIGDGANDMPMMDEAAFSVAYRAKPIVREFAAFALDHSGLDGVLNFFL
ncbi:MAG TPA: phosphoserine phosphatase SerB [Burkholderiales bacterium]|nr:phosphoserine phosphatase SerB [Burkholderiales bacterium]